MPPREGGSEYESNKQTNKQTNHPSLHSEFYQNLVFVGGGNVCVIMLILIVFGLDVLPGLNAFAEVFNISVRLLKTAVTPRCMIFSGFQLCILRHRALIKRSFVSFLGLFLYFITVLIKHQATHWDTGTPHRKNQQIWSTAAPPP